MTIKGKNRLIEQQPIITAGFWMLNNANRSVKEDESQELDNQRPAEEGSSYRLHLHRRRMVCFYSGPGLSLCPVVNLPSSIASPRHALGSRCNLLRGGLGRSGPQGASHRGRLPLLSVVLRCLQVFLPQFWHSLALFWPSRDETRLPQSKHCNCGLGLVRSSTLL